MASLTLINMLSPEELFLCAAAMARPSSCMSTAITRFSRMKLEANRKKLKMPYPRNSAEPHVLGQCLVSGSKYLLSNP